MKRFWAAAVDFIFSFMLNMVLFCLIISCWKLLRVCAGVDWHNNVGLSWIVLLFLVSFFLVSFLYSVIFDYVCKGKTPGKMIMGCNVYSDMNVKNFKWIIKHALFRSVASLFYMITVLYYFFTNEMIYDKAIRDKNT